MPILLPALVALALLAESEPPDKGSEEPYPPQEELDSLTDEPADVCPLTPLDAPQENTGSMLRASGDAIVTLTMGIDTNARRVIGEEAVTDAFAGLSGRMRGELLLGDRHLLHGRYDMGLKKFINLDDEDLMVQQLSLGYAVRALSEWTFETGANGKVRTSRNGLRDYLDLAGDLAVRRRLGHGFAIKGELGLRRFGYPQQDAYGYWSGELGLWSFWQIHRRVHLAFGVRGALPTYEGNARTSDATIGAMERRDRLISIRLQASYRGPVALQGGYLWVGNWSNSFGEDYQRHRLFAAMTARLPWSIFAGVHLAWQTLHYPDGLFLSDDLIDLLLYDDESQSNSTFKLARPLTEHFELELKYSLSWIDLPRRNDDTSLSYLRQVATLGFVGRF